MNQLTSVQIMGALACNPSKPGVAYLYPRFSDVFKEYRKELLTVMGSWVKRFHDTGVFLYSLKT